MTLLAIFGAMLILVIVCICCYCMKEKNTDKDAKIYYYKNVQPNNVEKEKLIEAKNQSITAITRVTPKSPQAKAKNLKPMNLEMGQGSFADKVKTESETKRQQRIWGEKKNSLVEAEKSRSKSPKAGS